MPGYLLTRVVGRVAIVLTGSSSLHTLWVKLKDLTSR